MATITLKGSPVHTFGHLPPVGKIAPPFRLTSADLTDVGLEALKGKKKILNIVPSLDTDVCAASARRFSEEVAKLNNVALLNISADLPFAQARFCSAFQAPNGKFLSTFRSPEFGMDYGTLIVEHALMGLQARAVIVLDERDIVRHVQLVPDTAREPDYAAAMAALE